ncbi:MAG: helix-turn-helix domain-containing protein [Dongiaceae bacterium]
MVKELNVNDIALEADLRLGRQIRARRKAKGLSIREAADKANLSPGLISQIERGFTSPSIRSLRRLCLALETPVDWFFGPQDEAAAAEEGIIVRGHRRRAHDLSSIGMIRQILTPDSSENIQLLILYLEPGCERLDKTKLQPADEAGLVISGSIRLDLDAGEFTLNEGDSFCIRRNSRYNFTNIGDETAELLWACTPTLY